jgi:hypothetical protein
VLRIFCDSTEGLIWGRKVKVAVKGVLNNEEGGQSKGVIGLIYGFITAGTLYHSDQP